MFNDDGTSVRFHEGLSFLILMIYLYVLFQRTLHRERVNAVPFRWGQPDIDVLDPVINIDQQLQPIVFLFDREEVDRILHENINRIRANQREEFFRPEHPFFSNRRG